MPGAAADRSRRLDQTHARGAEDRPAIALTEWRQSLELLDGVEREAGERRLAVERDLRQPQARRHALGHRCQKCLAEVFDLSIFDPQARRRRVAATGEQMFAARDECFVHIKPRHAPHTADRRPALMLVTGNHHDRPMPPLRQPPCHDPDHTGMPAAIGQYEGRIAFGVELLLHLLGRGQLDASLLCLAAGVEFVDIVGELHGSCCVTRCEQLDAAGGLSQSAGRVEPGRQTKRDVFTVELRLLMQLGQLQQPRDSRPATLPQALEAMLHIDPVLVEQRHDVGHRAERRIADRLEQHLPQPRRDLLGARGSRGDRPGQLEGHARAAEFAKGIVGPREPGMHEHVGIWKRVGEVVMVGDDQFQTQLPRP